jgi:hypothetical protein
MNARQRGARGEGQGAHLTLYKSNYTKSEFCMLAIEGEKKRIFMRAQSAALFLSTLPLSNHTKPRILYAKASAHPPRTAIQARAPQAG